MEASAAAASPAAAAHSGAAAPREAGEPWSASPRKTRPGSPRPSMPRRRAPAASSWPWWRAPATITCSCRCSGRQYSRCCSRAPACSPARPSAGYTSTSCSCWYSSCSAPCVLSIPGLHLLLVPRRVKHARASRLAKAQFYQQGVHLTPHHSGVLFFVSLAERYVEIVADKGIHEKLGEAHWQGIIDKFVAQCEPGRGDGWLRRRHRRVRCRHGRALSPRPRRGQRALRRPDRAVAGATPAPSRDRLPHRLREVADVLHP